MTTFTLPDIKNNDLDEIENTKITIFVEGLWTDAKDMKVMAINQSSNLGVAYLCNNLKQ